MSLGESDLTLLAPYALLGGLSASLIWLRGRSHAIWFFLGTGFALFSLQWFMWWGQGHLPPLGFIATRFLTIGASYLALFCAFCGYLYLLSTTEEIKGGNKGDGSEWHQLNA